LTAEKTSTPPHDLIAMQRLPLLPLLQICHSLPLSSLAALAQSCKRLANVVHGAPTDSSLWRSHCTSSTSSSSTSSSSSSTTISQFVFGTALSWRDLYALQQLILHRSLPRSLATASLSDASTASLLLARMRLAVAPIFVSPPPVLNVALLQAPRIAPLALAAAHVLRTLLDVFPRLVQLHPSDDQHERTLAQQDQQQRDVFILAPSRSYTPVRVCVLASSVPLDNVNAPATLVADAAAEWASRDAVLFVACGVRALDAQLTQDLLATADAQLVRRIAVFVSPKIDIEPFKALMWRATPSSPSKAKAENCCLISVMRSLDAVINWLIDAEHDDSSSRNNSGRNESPVASPNPRIGRSSSTAAAAHSQASHSSHTVAIA
jgi:hypothetical protein